MQIIIQYLNVLLVTLLSINHQDFANAVYTDADQCPWHVLFRDVSGVSGLYPHFSNHIHVISDIIVSGIVAT